MDNLYWLDRIQLSHRPVVGTRAFNLSQLLQHGYPVVPGFVVPANAFWEFIEILGESEPLLADLPHSSLHMDVDNPRQLQLVAQEIRQAMAAAALPPALASALSTASAAVEAPALILSPSLSLPLKGLQVGRLSVEYSKQPSNLELVTPTEPEVFGILDSHTCLRQAEALAKALKQAWGELFRARSLFYWQRHGVGLQQLNLAVLVQPIGNAIASGTLEANPTEWHIEATWGTGIALAKGEVLPDSYHLQATTGIVKAQQLGSKTRAYRPSREQDSSTRTKSGLQAYLLSEEQQQQYALEEKYLTQLIELSQRLTSEISPTFFSEWTLYQPTDRSEPQLYLTQLTPQLSKSFSVSRLQLQRSNQFFNLPYSTSTPSGNASSGGATPLTRTGNAAGTQNATSSETAPLRRTGTPTGYDFSSKVEPANVRAYMTPQIVRGLPAAGGRVTAPAHVIIGENPNLDTMTPGRILVAQSIAPQWLPLLKRAAGVVTERGGMTSHAAILARELGIPAVVGAIDVTQLIQTGESLLVDGNQGEIYRLGIMARRRGGEEVQGESFPSENMGNKVSAAFPALNFPIATQLLVNLSQPNSLGRIGGLPVDGVGLLRSELMMLDALENLHPNEWLRQGRGEELAARLAQLIVQFAAAFEPRPVFYRSSDWRSHEFQFLIGNTSSVEPEVNPIVGLRGTRCYLSDPACFDLELAALGQVYAYGYTNVNLMLPFVRDVEEFVFCRRRVEQAGLTDNPHFQLWMMAEVPSVLFLLPDYVKAGVEGISIGTNDLTQLLLAADRDQGQLSSTLDGRHPVVKQAIKQLIQMARKEGIPCSICGQAPAQYPELIDLLVRWGITSISVDANDLERTYMAIARAEQRLLLEAARQKI